MFLSWRGIFNTLLNSYLPKNRVAFIGINNQVRDILSFINNNPSSGYKPCLIINPRIETSQYIENVEIIHDIYRVDWDSYKLATEKLKLDGEENVRKQNTTTETIEEVDQDGNVTTKTITRNVSESENIVRATYEKNDFSNSLIIVFFFLKCRCRDF
jgi:hypothetical protein